MTYTEEELKELIKNSLTNVTIEKLDKSKVYVFKIPRGSNLESAQKLGHLLHDTLNKLSIQHIILLDDLIKIYELNKNEE